MIDTFHKIIFNAGEIIKENFYKQKEVKFKGLIDLVTQFDIEIENLLKDKLNSLFPEHLIIGEETSGNKNNNVVSKNRIYIDPIDGTTNFVHSIPFVSVSVAVYTDNKPYLGVVYNPILNEYFFAEKGKGAFLNNRPIKVSTTSSISSALVTTGFPYSIRENEETFQWNINVVKNVLKNTLAFRRLGSAAIDLCYVARGSYDIFYEYGLKPWDVAAGMLIVEEAGGKVSNIESKAYDLHHDRVIVSSNGILHNEFLELLMDSKRPQS